MFLGNLKLNPLVFSVLSNLEHCLITHHVHGYHTIIFYC